VLKQSYQDRRRRFTVRWDLAVAHTHFGEVRGRVVNISLTGLRFRVPKRYLEGSILEFEMSPSLDVQIRAYLRITREYSAKQGEFEYGAALQTIDDDDIAVFLDTLLELKVKDSRRVA